MRFGPVVARRTLFLLVGSCGMYIAAPAFLPSSFAMCLGMIAIGAWLQRDYTVSAVVYIATNKNIHSLITVFQTSLTVTGGDGGLGCLCGKAGTSHFCVMAPPIHLGTWSMAMAAF